MAYKTTRRKSRVNAECLAMRKGKALKQEKRAKELGSRVEHDLPVIRKMVIVLNFDFGLAVDVFWFRKTSRIDSYRVSSLKMIPEKMGWTVFCKRLSTYYPRLLSPLNLQ